MGRLRQIFELCHRADSLLLGLLQYISHTLAGCGDRLKLWHMQYALDRLRTCHRVHNIVETGSQDSFHHVVFEAEGVAQVELQTLAEELTDRADVVDLLRELT